MQSICRQNGQLWQFGYFESQLNLINNKKKKVVQKYMAVEEVPAEGNWWIWGSS